MKLGQLIKRCKVNANAIRYPVLLDLEVENAEEFCFYALQNYFKSKKFLEDLEKCKVIYNFYRRKKHSKYFILKRDIYGIFTIRLVID